MKRNLGKVTKESDGYKFVLERMFPHPVKDVWDALINPQKLKIWFARIEGEFRPGGEIMIRFDDEAQTISRATITRMEKPRLFEFLWEGEVASWKLDDIDGKQTKLTLTYSRIADHYAVSVPAGWHQILDQLETVLKGHTERYPFGGEPTQEGEALQKAYKESVLRDFPVLWEKTEGDEPITIERIFNASPERVWRAITDNDQMKHWYFEFDEFKPEPGFAFEFTAGSENKKWKHRCRVVEVIPEKKLSYTWEYPEYAGQSYVVWEISGEGNGTKLTLKHYGIETFPSDIPDLGRNNFVTGWNGIIGESLAKYLE